MCVPVQYCCVQKKHVTIFLSPLMLRVQLDVRVTLHVLKKNVQVYQVHVLMYTCMYLDHQCKWRGNVCARPSSWLYM